jgi:hypothetical protein
MYRPLPDNSRYHTLENERLGRDIRSNSFEPRERRIPLLPAAKKIPPIYNYSYAQAPGHYGHRIIRSRVDMDHLQNS